MKKCLLLFCLLLTNLGSMAYDVVVDGIYYNFRNDAMAVTVTHGYNKYSGDISIPQSVTCIGNNFFRDIHWQFCVQKMYRPYLRHHTQ